jgi:hypothetical protein
VEGREGDKRFRRMEEQEGRNSFNVNEREV